jgi:hypothetical protein
MHGIPQASWPISSCSHCQILAIFASLGAPWYSSMEKFDHSLSNFPDDIDCGVLPNQMVLIDLVCGETYGMIHIAIAIITKPKWFNYIHAPLRVHIILLIRKKREYILLYPTPNVPVLPACRFTALLGKNLRVHVKRDLIWLPKKFPFRREHVHKIRSLMLQTHCFIPRLKFKTRSILRHYHN